MNARIRLVSVGLLVGVFALGACSSDDEESTATTAGSTAETTAGTSAGTTAGTSDSATGAVLEISGFNFGSVTATAGQPITIENKDSAAHTVTADDGTFSMPVGPGATAELTIPAAGTYAIHCEIHSSMTGSIVVN